MENQITYYCFPKLDTYIDVPIYHVSQTYNHAMKRWEQREARHSRLPIRNVRFFRKTNDQEFSEYMITGAYVPTEYCTMEYYSEEERRYTHAMVAGNANELQKRLSEIRDKVREKEEKLYEYYKTL